MSQEYLLNLEINQDRGRSIILPLVLINRLI